MCNKIDEVNLCMSGKKIDVISFTESWLHGGILDCVIHLDGFIVHRDDRPAFKKGGGVCAYINANINHLRFYPSAIKPGSIECVFLVIKSANMLLCNIYIPPNLRIAQYDEINNYLILSNDEALLKWPNSTITFLGDFNRAPLMEFTTHCAVYPSISCATRGNTCLDQFFVPENLLPFVTYEIATPFGNSDHNTIYVSDSRGKSCNHYKCHNVYDFRRSNIDAFVAKIDSIDFNDILSGLVSVDDKVSALNIALKCALQMIPRHRVFSTSRDKPWMTHKLKLLINERWDAFRHSNLSKYIALKCKIKNEIILAKQQWVKKESSSSQKFWSVINDISGRRAKGFLSTLLNENDSYENLVNKINALLCSNYLVPEKVSKLPEMSVLNDWKFEVFEPDVLSEIINLKKKHSPKEDLPTRLYVCAANVIATPLCAIINSSIESLTVPCNWKHAEVTPIPKSFPVNINELRPISLLSVQNKIAERIVLKRMKPSFKKIMDKNQFAYRSQSSTTCALIEVLDFAAKNIDNKKYEAVAMVSIDFSKAFDQIDHGLLLQKLLNYDRKIVPNDFIIWLRSYLTNRTQQVVLNGYYSETLNITSGVPQGSTLGPYLFNIFVSDLNTVNDDSKLVKFADDTEILVPLLKKSIHEDCVVLGNEINNVLQWSITNNMKINTQKCKILYFRRASPNNCILPHEFHGINCCTNLKFLGITLNENLDFKEHFGLVLKKASQRLYFLRILKRSHDIVDLWKVFFALIRSVLEYAAPIFMALPKNISEKIERIQRRAHRIICGDHCTNCSLPTLADRRVILGTRLFNKIINSGDEHPIAGLLSSFYSTQCRNTKFIMPVINNNTYKNTFVIQNIFIHNNIVID